jgi:hypothetical protein
MRQDHILQAQKGDENKICIGIFLLGVLTYTYMLEQ